MPVKSKAQRRKFAELLVEGKISGEVYERWNREAGRKELPERVTPTPKPKKAKPKATTRSRSNGKPKAATRSGVEGEEDDEEGAPLAVRPEKASR